MSGLNHAIISVILKHKNYYYCYNIVIIIIIIIIIITIIIVVVVVVDDDTYYWVYLSSDRLYQVYYKVRQLFLLQSATAFLLQSATSVITKCDRYYKV